MASAMKNRRLTLPELSSNLLDRIFAFAQNPDLRLVCRAMHATSKRTETRAMYLMYRFLTDSEFQASCQVPAHPKYVLQHAIRSAFRAPIPVLLSSSQTAQLDRPVLSSTLELEGVQTRRRSNSSLSDDSSGKLKSLSAAHLPATGDPIQRSQTSVHSARDADPSGGPDGDPRTPSQATMLTMMGPPSPISNGSSRVPSQTDTSTAKPSAIPGSQSSLPSTNTIQTSLQHLQSTLQGTLLTVDVVRQLVVMGADIHGDNEYFLRWAATTQSVAYFHILESLTARQDYLMTIRIMEDTPLRLASQRGCLEVVQYLVKRGADIAIKRHFPLRVSVKHGHASVARFLIEMGSDMHMDDDFVLRTFAGQGQLDMVRWLIERGAATPGLEYDRDALEQAFMEAYMNGHGHVMLYLINEAGCNTSENVALLRNLPAPLTIITE